MSLSSDISRLYKKRLKITEIREGLKNSLDFGAKFVFLLRNPLKNGGISEKKSKLESE